jgi:hypothetical protein
VIKQAWAWVRRDKHGEELAAIKQLMTAVLTTVTTMEKNLMAILDDLNAAIATLQTSVTNETSVDQSVLTLISGLASQITALAAQVAALSAGSVTQAQIDAAAAQITAVATTMTTNAAALSAAVTANQAPAPTPPAQPAS